MSMKVLWLIAGGLALFLYGTFVVWLVKRGRREQARALAGFIPDCVVLFKRLLDDPRVPRQGKILLGVTMAYLAMPFDFVPDFIPVAGQLDDVIIVGWVLRKVLHTAGKGLLTEHWPGPKASLDVMLRLMPPSSPSR
jgi:uncharacterized membrane protein YkvA (DUF1232 family)